MHFISYHNCCEGQCPAINHLKCLEKSGNLIRTGVESGQPVFWTKLKLTRLLFVCCQGLDIVKTVALSLPVCPQATDVPPLSIRARSVRIGSVMLQRVQQCTFFVKAIRITFTPEGSTGNMET